MSKIACYDNNDDNDMFFAIKFSDEDYERGKTLALKGWNDWWRAEDNDEIWYYGFEERSLELLDAAGIKYEVIHSVPDEDTQNGVAEENDGWPLWFDPNTITDYYLVGDKI